MFKNQAGQIRSGWKILLTSLLLLVIVIIINVVMEGVIQYLYNQGTFITDAATANTVFFFTTMFLQEAIYICIPILIWKYAQKQPLTRMGLPGLGRHWKEFLVGLGLGTLSIAAVFLFLAAIGSIKTAWSPQLDVTSLLFLLLFILVGFAEETFSRGYIMSTLRQTKNRRTVVLVSAVIFALMHIANSNFSILPFINITAVGILFAFMYIQSGNIWMPIGYHITWNYFQGAVFGFSVSGADTGSLFVTENAGTSVLNGGEFGPEGGIAVTAVILLGLVFVQWYYRKKNYDFFAPKEEAISGFEETPDYPNHPPAENLSKSNKEDQASKE